MNRKSFLGLVAAGCALTASAASWADGRDPDTGSRAQERLDRDTQRATERAAERDMRYAEEKARIEERTARDPAKAAEDLAKLDADLANEQQKASEDLAKAQEDFAEESAKEAAEALEDAAERGGDSSGHGSSEQIRDLGDSEGAEHDERGFAIRRGELVGIDLPAATLRSAEAKGFRVIGRQRLERLDREVIRLATPPGTTALDAREMLRAIDPGAVVDYVHYYGLDLTAGSRGRPVRARGMASESSQAMAVGVIDTAIAPHRALGGARVVAWAAGGQAGAPVNHGTAIASILAARGRATIYSANIFRGAPARPFTSADVIADALEWMLAQNVATINMSLAGPRNAILDRLVRDAMARGRIVVAAAGNGGPTAPPAYPAAVPGVVAVTAVDRDLRVYRYANHGRYITVAAHGVDVLAAHAPGGFARFTGTSFATPHVAGWIARCRAGGAGANQCRERLRAAARDLGAAGYDDIYGFGFVP